VTLNVSFAGSGAATTASRSDHDHTFANWSAAATGAAVFKVTNTGGFGLFMDGIWGQADAANTGRGVVGYSTPTSGAGYGVWGQSDSTTGGGVFGLAAAGSGLNYGVYGQTNSSAGYAGYFQGRIGTDSSIDFGAVTRQMLNLFGGAYAIGVQSFTTYFRSDFGFAWYRGGVHADVRDDPGAGGTRQMRLDSAGNLFVSGTVNPGGADFAEMLPGERGLEAGDVVAIGPDGSLFKSDEPYQMAVAGVVSTQPGLVGGAADGEDTSGKVPLAVVGIVPVKASAEAGPIRPGDRLVASATPGHAMRSAKEVRVGSVIGKALSSLEAGTGVVRMLVVLQ
jgi:hypothetical protein